MKQIFNYTRLLMFIGIGFLALVSFKAYQGHNNPIEKIYTQTDRPFYFPGETVWFKSYIVGTDHTVTSISDVMRAELISPKGTVVESLKLNIKQGYAYGNFNINKEWLGGIYTLKCYTNWMRNYGDDAFFTKKITVQKIVNPNLLLNLKFEKEGYGKSSEVISKLEVKDLKNNPLAKAEITYKVSVNGDVVISERAITDDYGKFNPSFKLPKNLNSSDVILNVLVDYGGSTESISRPVPVVLNTIDLQFLPESGKIIAGADNLIAFKALNEFGKPVDIKGEILSENNKVISAFESYHDGMGSFNLTPSKGETYYAQITEPFHSEKPIQLPKVYENGVRFSVITDSLKTKLNIFSTDKPDLFLEVSNASGLLLMKKIVAQNTLEILTRDFPMGITKFSLKNQNGQTVAERLVFLNAHKKLHVDLILDRTEFNTREKVKLIVKTYDHQNNPTPANLAVAIADNKLLSFADDKQDHILSYLLLSSELKGKIYKPDFYLNPSEPKSHKALDYVMLTHGWRDYFAKPTISIDRAKFLPEQYAIQTGVIHDKSGNPTQAHLMLFNRRGDEVLVFETEKDGSFTFKFNENEYLTMLAYKDSGEFVTIEKTELKKVRSNDQTSSQSPENKSPIKRFNKNVSPLKKSIKQKATVSVGLEGDSKLEEVVVVGYNTASRSKVAGSIVRAYTQDAAFNGASIINTLSGQASGLAIVNASGQPGNPPLISLRGMSSISGNNQPLVVVDNIVYDPSELGDINPELVKSVNILKDPTATAAFGSRGGNGVIYISTKHSDRYEYGVGSRKLLSKRQGNHFAIEFFNNRQYNRLDKPGRFYMPKYEGDELVEERNDFRQTIYWNPIVQTNSKGIAELEFYNSDAVTSFKITAEGIGYNGLLGRADTLYATKKLLNLDFKTPNHMVLNDTISLPITIKNETENPMVASLKIQLPDNLKMVSTIEDTLVVDAKNAITKHIDVIPLEKSQDKEIRVFVQSGSYRDVVKKDISILSPYFPTNVSFSDSKSKRFQFEMNNVVDNSLTSEFTIYTDVIGDVMDGIESMIRQPYGCFEQTSSATYPNIMVLKYLNESGKSNPKIEAKALRYIKKGYKKLVSFETSKGGFEWFGDTPPHETLTAYGILEFTEMKEVYDGVSQKMIDRTIDWLLSRRDGKGGFKKSKFGFTSFSSSPSDVANAYIVYALSEAGVDIDFDLEYRTAFRDALNSNDSYKMALLALASRNLNKDDNFNLLIDKIKANIQQFGFEYLPVKNTITRSYGNAKNIESAALTVLALLEDDSENIVIVTKGINHILKQRNNNRFGSTQSTAMALKALINYTKTQKQKIIKDKHKVTIIVNGKSLTTGIYATNNGKIVVGGINEYLKPGKQTIEVKFSNEKNTFPYNFNINWDSTMPDSSDDCVLDLKTTISDQNIAVGDNVSFNITIENTLNEPLGMVTSVIAIPSGTTAQPWQLKKILEEKQIAFYEVFENYIVFYWRAFKPLETKNIRLDLKADIPGNYQAPASTAYLYYGDEHKIWIAGNKLKISE